VRVDIRWPGRRGDVGEADVTGDTKCAVRVLSAEVVRCDPGLPFVRRWGMAMVLDGHRLVVADFHGSAIVELSDDASRGTVVGQSREPSFRETLAVAYADDRYLVVNSKAQKRQS
jgi:hypothetical protein